MDEIRIGDVVHLKSGSPKMTVVEIVDDIVKGGIVKGGDATVVYLPYGHHCVLREKIPVIALVKK